MFYLRFRFPFRCASATAAALSLLAVLAPGAQAQVAVTTSHNDNARSGLNAAETTLNIQNVNVARFGKLFSRSVDSKIWCQPLYVPNVSIAGKGVRNVVYVVSENGTVYAFDADNAAETAPLWKVSLLPGPFTTADQNVSSPVIDLASNTIYLTLKNNEGNWVFRLFALDIRTGAQKANSGQIMTATVPGTGKGSVNGQLTLNSPNQKQRPSLLLSGGKIYAAFGGSVDEFDPYVSWNGWIFVYDAATLAREQVFTVAPNANGGGIWQAGNGLSADASGNIYAATGNGNGIGENGEGQLYSFSADKGGFDFGNSILKLSLQNMSGTRPGILAANGKALSIADYWTPYNWQYMEEADQDLGSSGILLIPGTSYAATGDKIGHLYVLDTRNMGKLQANSNSQIVADFPAWKGNLHGGYVYYAGTKFGPMIYGWSENDHLKAFRVADLTNKSYNGTPVMQSNAVAPPGMPGGFLSVSANGNQSGSGIVWAYTPYEGDANQFIVPGVLHAFDAGDLSRELWNSKMLTSRDDSGLYSKFSNPTIANGKVYLSSFSNQLLVYGLLPATSAPASPTNLKATGELGQVSLSWSAVSGATSYSLQRATTVGGPYVPVATNLLTPNVVDTQVQNGTRYFYVVVANNAGGESAKSNEANATPFAAPAGSVISVDFNGNGSHFGNVNVMGTDEVAGVVPVANWNSAVGAIGTLNGLQANGGTSTSTTASWTCLGTAVTDIPDTSGNNRMMKGYLAGEDPAATNFSVRNLPASFTSAGYDVYVYSDGINPTATRAANFSINGTTLVAADAENRNFEGTFFQPGVAGIGNFVVFKNLNLTDFTLNAVPGASTDETPRAPLNGVQIVAHQSVPAPSMLSPTRLTAQPGHNRVWLSWNAVSGATSYSVKRAIQPGGSYSVVGTASKTDWGDVSAQNGTTYFYVVTAKNTGLESAPSNEATATPLAAYVGSVLSVDFGGGTTPAMTDNEVAGANGVTRSHWNPAISASGSLTDLKDDKSASTPTDITWSGEGVADTSIANTPDHFHMMRGYLIGNKNAVQVKVSSLPASFTQNGYDVYLYVDGNNGGARTGRYTMGTQSASITDASNKQFSGSYVQGNDSTGNYLRLVGFTGSSFTLSAASLSSADGINGAPLNGLQIVARNASPGLSSAPHTLSVSPTALNTNVGVAQNLNVVYGDGDGATDIYAAYTRVGVSPIDDAPLDVYYNGAQNRLYLYDGTRWIGGFAPGSPQVIVGPRGSLNCAKTVVSRIGPILTISWNLTPSLALVGQKYVYCRVQDKTNHWEDWRRFSFWKISAPSVTNAKSTPSGGEF